MKKILHYLALLTLVQPTCAQEYFLLTPMTNVIWRRKLDILVQVGLHDNNAISMTWLQTHTYKISKLISQKSQRKDWQKNYIRVYSFLYKYIKYKPQISSEDHHWDHSNIIYTCKLSRQKIIYKYRVFTNKGRRQGKKKRGMDFETPFITNITTTIIIILL